MPAGSVNQVLARIHGDQKLRDALNALGADKQRLFCALCTGQPASLTDFENEMALLFAPRVYEEKTYVSRGFCRQNTGYVADN
jgi:hypothetical protein